MTFQSGIKVARITARFLAANVVMAALAPAAPDFSREVRPLLEKHCFKCHGPEKQKGGLRYDTKEGAFKAGVETPSRLWRGA